MREHAVVTESKLTVYETKAGKRQAYFVADNSVAQLSAEEAATEFYAAMGARLNATGMSVAHERIFGTLDARDAVMQSRHDALQAAGIDPHPAVSYIQGRPVFGAGFAGAIVQAVRPDSGSSVQTLFEMGAPWGRAWVLHGVGYIAVQSAHGSNGLDRGDQASQMFAQVDARLHSQSASYRDVVRTWLYLSHILDWYGDFNRARDVQYARFGLMPNLERATLEAPLLLPASTGIEGYNACGSDCLMDALVITGPKRPAIRQMANARQKDAFRYGSAFSRGACICEADTTRIELSGTAAIDEEGKSVHVGDTAAQIHHTLEAIEALLNTEQASLKHMAAATVFFKEAEDYPLFLEGMKKRKLNRFPAVLVHADVCRGDLLFEMDGTAVLKTPSKP